MPVFRLSAFAGVLSVVLVVVGFIVGGDTPDADATASEVRAFYSSHDVRQATSAYLVALGAVFLVIFGVRLFGALREREGTAPRWSPLALAGAIVSATGFLVAAAGAFAVVDVAGDAEVGGAALQAMHVLSNWSWVPFVGGFGLMLLGAAGALLRDRRTRDRRFDYLLGWLALIIGIAIFIPFVGFIAFIAAGVWIILVSLVIWQDAAPDRPVALDRS